MSDVRVSTSVPTADDFVSKDNSPIVINSATDIAYYLKDSTVTPLQATGGLRHIEVTAVLDFASIAANSIGTLNVTVTGAEVSDTVLLGPPSTIEAELIWCGYVSAADTVTIRLHNKSGGAIDPASATWHVGVFT